MDAEACNPVGQTKPSLLLHIWRPEATGVVYLCGTAHALGSVAPNRVTVRLESFLCVECLSVWRTEYELKMHGVMLAYAD